MAKVKRKTVDPLERALKDLEKVSTSKIKKTKRRKRVTKKQTSGLNLLVDELVSMKESDRKAQQIRDIIPIEEWVNNEYYCGAGIFNLYPYWKKHLIAIYNSPVLINEVILTRRYRNTERLRLRMQL